MTVRAACGCRRWLDKSALQAHDRGDMARSKDEVTQELVDAHFRIEPALSHIYRIRSDREDDPREPIKLLEVNANTVATGSVDSFSFAPTKDTPSPTVIAEVTPEEFRQIQSGEIALPRGWSLQGAVTFVRTHAA
jgi:hypothetical protein